MDVQATAAIWYGQRRPCIPALGGIVKDYKSCPIRCAPHRLLELGNLALESTGLVW